MVMRLTTLLVAAWLAAAPAFGQDGAGEKAKMTPQAAAQIADAVSPWLVRVEYTAKYDKGDAPPDSRNRFAGPGRFFFPGMGDWTSWEGAIRQERPIEHTGILLTPTRVVTMDPEVHPRFIKSIRVRCGDRLIDAKPIAYGVNERAMFLELAEPVPGAEPLEFDASLPGPYKSVSYAFQDGEWVTAVESAGGEVVVTERGERYSPAAAGSLIVTADGKAVGMTTTGRLPIDGSWKGSPLEWIQIDGAGMNKLLDALRASSDGHLLRVTMNFRSPRNDDSNQGLYGYGYGDDSGQITEWHGTGVLIDEGRVLVLASLEPKVTARLETIKVFKPDGGSVGARFAGTLKDYGALLAKLDSPISGAPVFATDDVRDYRGTLTLVAEINVQGQNRTGYYKRAWIPGFYRGWRRQIYPQVDATNGPGMYGYDPYGQQSGGAHQRNFLYNRDGQLVALPLVRREKVTVQDQWGGNEMLMIPVTYLAPVLADPAEHLDKDNVPLSEEEENRLAWLGVEMQPLGPELARMNHVSDRTNDGQTGGMVTFIYAGSPAEKAGVQMGDILLRLHPKGHPKPLDVTASGESMGMMDGYWQMFSQMDPSYFGQIPQPWPSVDNPFNQSLTEIGFGTPFVLDVFRDGKLIKMDMAVTQGPAYYGSAPRFKSEPLGLTVRDLTYEVRRFYQKTDDDPGVIISKIEPGEKAAVAGLAPYEIITHVNDQPVADVAAFERLIKGQQELRLSVKRMTQGRIVKIKVDADTGAGEPADAPERGEQDATPAAAPASGTP